MNQMFKTRSNKSVYFRKLHQEDSDLLFRYLNELSPLTHSRFAPHSFEKSFLDVFCREFDAGYFAFGAFEAETNVLIAYALLKKGYVEHDYERLSSYGVQPDSFNDYTYAPSVADAWQSEGIGFGIFKYMLTAIDFNAANRIFLWGGVQVLNDKAMNFYSKIGFRTLGQFNYYGMNNDMIYELVKSYD